MENQKKKKLSNWDFLSGIGEKNILFGIGNGAEFRPQNRVIKSPERSHAVAPKIFLPWNFTKGL